MKRGWEVTAVLTFAAALAATAAAAQAPDPALVEQGEYVARAGDCSSCHTAAGGAAFAGGYPVPSPMGAIFSSNITPSKTHGIGNFSLADFSQAVRHGVAPGGKHLYPAMPYPFYRGATDDDVAALYAYFMLAVEPVDTSPPETTLPFPFDPRILMIGWNLLYGGNGFTPMPDASAAVQRGQYLVETLGHCSACHSPRNMLMGEERSRHLAGGVVEGWQAPNITSDPVSGIGAWSEEELVAFLRDGFAPGKNVAAGDMAQVVQHSLRYLSDDDLAAIAAYLKTVPAIAEAGVTRAAYGWTEARPAAVTTYETGSGPLQSDLAQSGTLDGAVLYNGACASCHGVDGTGTADLFYPSLTASATVGALNPANLVLTIVDGVNRESGSGHVFMQTFGDELTDAQVASVASYVTARFGNPDVVVDEATVAELRAGGPKPPILAAAPYLAAGVPAGLLVVMLAAIFFFVRRRHRPA